MTERLLCVTGRGFVAGAVFTGEPGKGEAATVLRCAPILNWTRRLRWQLVRAELKRRGCTWQWL